MRRTAARLAHRHVRRLSRRSADRLMAIAAETGLAHKGIGLPKLRGCELTDVVGSLAAASPVIRWDGTLSPGASEPE